MFEKWVEDVSERLQALTGGKTFNRLGSSVQTTLRCWFDEGMTADAAAQVWFQRSQTIRRATAQLGG